MMKVKYILFTLTMMLGGVFVAGSAGAITETREVDVQFTFNPVLTVSLSSADILISDLVPGGVKNSNEIGVTVETNNSFGYLLTATVGNTENDSRNLVHTNGAAVFSSIEVGSSLSALATDSTWGYSVDSGTTFSGLPKWDDATGVAELNSSTGAAEETTNFLIGAKAAAGQLAGDYSNVINFFAVSKIDAEGNTKYKMQDLTAAQCTTTPITAVDSRDNSEYVVQRLNDGKCWMMENLRLGSTGTMTLTPEDTNITANWTLPASGTANFDTTNGYTNAAINIDSRDIADSYGSKYGTYYNYCAASAGQICMDSNSGTSATTDVCPKGWRMPTGGVNGEIQALLTAYNIGDNTAGSMALRQTLKVPLSGLFLNTSASSHGTHGYLWSSTYANSTGMYDLLFEVLNVHPWHNISRRYGFPVRCVLQ